MTSASPPPGRPVQARRQQVIDALCEAFARDEMGLEDFERRVETAHRTEEAAALDGLLADLPSVGVPATAGVAGARPSPRAAGGRVAVAADAPVRAVVAGIMGGAGRRGRWVPPRRVTAVAIMGGVELDFREAVFQPGVTEVHAFAFWGGVEILVPPDIRLESSGIGIMGGFDTGDQVGADGGSADPAVPILRVTGVAVMGGVEVKVRFAGETGREARRRIREEQRRRRLGEGGGG